MHHALKPVASSTPAPPEPARRQSLDFESCYGLPGTASEIHSGGPFMLIKLRYGLPGTASEIHYIPPEPAVIRGDNPT